MVIGFFNWHLTYRQAYFENKFVVQLELLHDNFYAFNRSASQYSCNTYYIVRVEIRLLENYLNIFCKKLALLSAHGFFYKYETT